ncbi:MAG: hypothetical protein ACIALR_04820 [Blastopirellula sp. JB062]
MAEEDLSDTIKQAAADPQRVTVDGISADARSIKDLIEADRYLASKKAAKGRRRGLVISKLRPPGTV